MKRLIILLLPMVLFANPAQVIIMRNAETPDGTSTLNLKGRERSAALDPYFRGAPEVNFYGSPVAIYVAKDAAATAQTVDPISKSTDISLNDSYSSSNSEALSKEILNNPDFEAHTVVVCWPAEQIPALARHLGAKKTPKKWEANDHDRFWILTYSDDGLVTFKNQPQKLLYGDTK